MKGFLAETTGMTVWTRRELKNEDNEMYEIYDMLYLRKLHK